MDLCSCKDLQTLKNNKDGDCFACRNRFHTRRITENVTFIKTWVVDVDNDINDEIRLMNLISDIIDEGNTKQIKPKVLSWYNKNKK